MSKASVVNVPFLDLKQHHERIWPELEAATRDVMLKGQFALGPAVERFEASFAGYIGTKYCVGVNSGTAALHLALQACDVGPGDEVITTPHTWISTTWAISYVGAKPVYVDIDANTYNIDPRLIERAITKNTKAILPVHLYGQACDMDALSEIARQHDLILIEDAAQAHGACYDGRRVGSLGRVGCFSFYPGKNLGAFGEGGAIVTDDEQLAARVRRLRDHAQDGRHHHVELGYNARMDGVQGAVLDVKLRYLPEANAARWRHAARYLELLADVSAIELPGLPPEGSHVWHLFVILVPEGERDRFREHLAQHGVASGIHYPTPLPLQPAYAHLEHKSGDFPVAENVMSRCVSLPMFPELTEDQIEHTASVVRAYFA